MTDTLARQAPSEPHAQSVHEAAGSSSRQACNVIAGALVTGFAFGLYWHSSTVLQAGSGTMHFGADSHLYSLLAQGKAVDRVVRFHPVTVALALAWMTVCKPLAAWIAPQVLLKAMFAAIGAAGVGAAVWAFSSVVSRRSAALWGLIYALSFGVWYFSSIEESKIVTATLSSLYIALYLHLRNRWTAGGAASLTLVLLAACLNEIVSGFLVIIPVVDTLARWGRDFSRYRWIAVHALAGPAALIILEVAVNGWIVPVGQDAEGASHVSMLLFYLAKNDYSPATLYAFLLNWLFFNIAAPAAEVRLWVAGMPYYGTYFDPALANYLTSIPQGVVVAALSVLVVASALSRYRTGIVHDTAGILYALVAFSLARGMFFLIFNPREPLLFSPAVTLAHLLVAGGLLSVSSVPLQRVLLGVLAALLLVANGAFIIASGR